MKKLLAIVMMLLVLGLTGCGIGDATSTPQSEEKVKLGIIQIVEHPSLDAARNGFLDLLKEQGYVEGEKLVVDYQNAQGDQGNLQTIARKLVQDKNDLILAVATPSAMMMANETTEIPILITAVTDPVSAKLVKSMEKPETNVTGTTDMNPIKDQLQLIKDIVPTAKKIGLIYNASEINSQVQVDIADKEAPELGLELVKVTVTASSEVMQAAQSLVGRVDAIYLPTDNMVISSLAAVLKVAEENKLPVIAGEGDSVENGALATVGIDYYQLGRTTGEMALRIINGEKPQEMAIQSQSGSELVINLQAAERMGVTVPEELIAKAKKVIK
ncbi:ABC transporter substrate-binding protein [Desulforamulus ferrireducens]|uniref:ABC transporter substrate-binding protein n=1 Tax=Desulforamulus ferrireducens TaxID=1833852 RepID=A0A1S6IWQ0_9FIRM|nr:ABC transporter substrate-binding protein [Desulforamulus ferrireducens]AQS59201.1 ABC transporter substrate-binding protein [Desulforamulus ferrireducens]